MVATCLFVCSLILILIVKVEEYVVVVSHTLLRWDSLGPSIIYLHYDDEYRIKPLLLHPPLRARYPSTSRRLM